MSRPDYEILPDVNEIMEKLVEKYPIVFPGYDSNNVFVVFTKGKKYRKVVKVRSVRYPYSVKIKQPYVMEVFKDTWDEITQKQKNLSVFRSMLHIPEGGFDSESNFFGKIRKPDYEMFVEELSVSGGVPGWLDDDSDAKDPMDKPGTDGKERKPVTKGDVENIK